MGTFCSDDCSSLLLCNQIDKPPENPLPCASISEHPFCKENGDNTASCSADTATCKGLADSGKILCGGFGEFLHPLDCRKTVRCEQSGQEPVKTCHCPDGDFINSGVSGLPCITEGDPPNQLPDNCQQTYAERCPNIGDSDTYGTNFHYVCTDDNAIIVSFATNPIPYSDIVSKANEKVCVSTPASSPPPTDSSTTIDPTLPTSCSKPGDAIKDPSDCHSYYWCNKELQYEHRKCPKGNYYNPDKNRCLPGDC